MSPHAQAIRDAIAAHRHDVVTVPAQTLVRVTRHASNEPHWSVGGNSRFDCPARGAPYGVNYSAPALSTAFAESVLRDEKNFDPVRSQWTVSNSLVLGACWVVELQRPSKPDLALFPLFGDQLTRLNIGNAVSAGNDYATTREISRVVHDDAPDLDGIAYVSNRANRSMAVALFERSGVQARQAAGRYHPLSSHPDLPDVLRRFHVAVMP